MNFKLNTKLLKYKHLKNKLIKSYIKKYKAFIMCMSTYIQAMSRSTE